MGPTKEAEVVTLKQIEDGKSKALVVAESYACVRDGDLVVGRDHLNGYKNVIDNIKGFFKPLKQAQDVVKKKLLDSEKEHLEDAEKGKLIIEGKMKVFVDEREAKAAEERKAQEEIRQKAEDEQRKRDEEASKKAAELQKRGKGAQAREVLAQNDRSPVLVPEVAPPPPPPADVKGLSTGKKWTAEVTNLKALCLAIGEGKAPVAYVSANITPLNAVARAAKNNDIGIPGVVGVSETAIGSRR